MVRSFGILTKIELTDEQNMQLNNFVDAIAAYDTSEEVEEIVLSFTDITGGHLNTEFCPVVVLNTDFPSDALYEGVKEKSEIIPEYVSRPELVPSHCVTLWKRGE